MKTLVKNNLSNQQDGFYLVAENRIVFEDFTSEKQMVSFLVNNIHLFTKQYLDDEVVDFFVDQNINSQKGFQPRGRRIDLLIKGKKYTYIIETKNAKNATEIRSGIGQLLDYGREFINTKKKMVLVSNLFDINTGKTIEHYNLPITYIVFNKKFGMIYDKSN